MGFSLGDISPLAGLISGKGMFGDLATSARDKLGIRDAEQKRADELAAAEGAAKSKAAAPVTKAKGGTMENSKKDVAQDKAVVKKAFKLHDSQEHPGKHTDLSKLARGGNFKANPMASSKTKASPTGPGKIASRFTGMAKGGNASKRADGCATKGKTKGRFV